jgi:phosphoribosylamine-glycine ligase
MIQTDDLYSAQSFMRNCIGSVFPLFTNQLYDRLGVQGAGSLTAGIGTLSPLPAIPSLTRRSLSYAVVDNTVHTIQVREQAASS